VGTCGELLGQAKSSYVYANSNDIPAIRRSMSTREERISGENKAKEIQAILRLPIYLCLGPDHMSLCGTVWLDNVGNQIVNHNQRHLTSHVT